MAKFKPHPIHGDNATIPRCWWCGAARNELVKMGDRVIGEAPMYMTIDYKPCEACIKRREGALTMVEVTTQPNPHYPPITTSHEGVKFYPTKRWATAPMDDIIEMFEPKLQVGIRRDKIAFMDIAVYNSMLEKTSGAGTSNSIPSSIGSAPSSTQ